MSTKNIVVKHSSDIELIAKHDATRLPLDNDCVDLVIGSPPYPHKGERYEGLGKLGHVEWTRMMAEATAEALRVCRGPVLWVVNNPVVDGRYIPAIAMLEVVLFQQGVIEERPLIWHKNAPPNRKDWWGNDWEQIIAFKKVAGPVKTWNWETIGTPPKYTNGGKFRQRDKNGKRREGSEYPKNPVTRPRDVIEAPIEPPVHLYPQSNPAALIEQNEQRIALLEDVVRGYREAVAMYIKGGGGDPSKAAYDGALLAEDAPLRLASQGVRRVTVGGGHMGSKLAHDGEAPFPEKLIEPLILALTNPGDVVLDPFCGTGTTPAVAQRLGRGVIGFDIRQESVDQTIKRLASNNKAS